MLPLCRGDAPRSSTRRSRGNQGYVCIHIYIYIYIYTCIYIYIYIRERERTACVSFVVLCLCVWLVCLFICVPGVCVLVLFICCYCVISVDYSLIKQHVLVRCHRLHTKLVGAESWDGLM